MTNQIEVTEVVNQVVVQSPGPQGPPASPADIFYTHTQSVPSDSWVINHNLDGKPTAVVFDSANTQCEGTFSYPNNNQMVITFTSAFAGVAYII